MGSKGSKLLGHYMTPDGIKPMQDKIDSVLKMGRPQNQTEVQLLFSAVTIYKSMWPRRLHVLAPLHELTGTGTFIGVLSRTKRLQL